MEDLTKQQVILIALLLSFVTSIGTGIITSALLSEAPTSVTQTINRVVEKTIERVVPADNTASVKPVTVKETVVVKEEDLVIDAIAKNSGSLVRIKGVLPPETTPSFYGIGFVINKDGGIVASKNIIKEGGSYEAILPDGSRVQLNKPLVLDNDELALFTPSDKNATSLPNFSAIKLTDSDLLKLGQSVVALGGENKNEIALGRILGLNSSSSEVGTSTPKTTAHVIGIETDAISKEILTDHILFNLSGEVIGFGIIDPETDSVSYLLSNAISKELTDLLEAKTQ